MKSAGKAGAQKVCPKTGKVIEPKRRYRAVRWLLPLTGLGALVWFLIRVIPKPSRATYPCQRVAFPLASGFIIWLTGLVGSAVAYRRAKACFVRARYVVGVLCIIVSIGLIWAAISTTLELNASAWVPGDCNPRVPQAANAPIGTAKGIHPGRVAWIHDANATDWDYVPFGSEHWFEPGHTDQPAVTDMMSKAVRTLAGAASDSRAWEVIFKYFNREHGNGAVGYMPGEKIAIKVNFTTCYNADPCVMDKPSDPWWQDGYNWIDNSPQLAIALLGQLVNVAGVSESDITIGDPGRIMPNYWYNMVSAAFPNVIYLTRDGYAGCGRTISTWDMNAPFYFSDPNLAHWTGVIETDHIPTSFSQANYVINFAILKTHSHSGITLCGKNNYGSLIRNPDAHEVPTPSDWYNMHLSRILPDESPGMGYYRAIVDLAGHPQLGGKTLLYLLDGLFAGEWWNAVPVKWNLSPFNGDWPSSIFLSQDGVAVDSVGFDFVHAEWPKNGGGGEPAGADTDGADDYLHEDALANDPCSGTFYDPNGDGVRLASLGVHEHWNNSADKQYTRNLGTGDGIELLTGPRTLSQLGDFDGDGDVDLADFAILAAAWGSEPGEGNWNPACDISAEQDNVIDGLDAMVFCINWLEGASDALIEPGAELQEVYSASKFFEGPTWDANSGKLYFTNRTDSQIMRLDSPGSATVWMNGAPGTNGTFLALDGRLLTADEDTQQIRSHRIGASGPEDSQVLAGPADGVDKKPNDLCQLQNGNIYFTCPDWATGPTEQGIYLLKTNGTVTRVATGLYQPNGVIASNNGTKLYVSESSSSDINKKRWWVYPINPDGTLGTGSVFFKPASPPGSNDPDGMTIDIRGNLYFSGLGGVWIVSPAGEELAMVEVPQACSNITFGGASNKTLYITCQNKVYSLAMRVAGGGWGGSQIPTEPTIAATDAAITIDGNIESAWNSARVYTMDNILLGSVSDDNDLSGVWRAIWDYNNLYLLVEITDDVQYNDSPSSTPWEDDVVELYIDADHSQGASYDGTNDYELVFRWNDPGVIHLGVYSATNTTGMDFVIVDTATGYRFEAALPWSAMGVTPIGGNYIGLDVHTCDDDDGGNREAKKAWWAQTDDSWQWPNIFASVRLTGTSVPPVPPGQASNPSPTGTGVGINADLSWTAGTNATSHDVYFGTDSTPDAGEFQDNQPGTTFEPGTLDYDTTYYWRIDEKNEVGTTTGIVWSFTTASAPGPLPSPWISYDIDSPGAAGSASYSSGVFTVSGSGDDIAGTSDAGQFVYQPASDNCTIIARVVSLTDVVADWAKAGIMFRDSLDPNSTFAYGNYTTNVSRSVNSWTLLHRDTTGGGATQTVWGNVPPPYWLKVVRSGNSFTGYVSSTGSSWTVITTVNIPMTSNVYVGMAVTSHQAGSLSTATFDNVSVTP